MMITYFGYTPPISKLVRNCLLPKLANDWFYAEFAGETVQRWGNGEIMSLLFLIEKGLAFEII